MQKILSTRPFNKCLKVIHAPSFVSFPSFLHLLLRFNKAVFFIVPPTSQVEHAINFKKFSLLPLIFHIIIMKNNVNVIFKKPAILLLFVMELSKDILLSVIMGTDSFSSVLPCLPGHIDQEEGPGWSISSPSIRILLIQK